MADSFLITPRNWFKGTLAPDLEGGLIHSVDSGGTPSTKEARYWDGNIPWLTPKEVTELDSQIYVSRTERTITAKGIRESGAKLMPPGTVMLTKRAPVGACVINAVPMATNQGFLNFRCGPRLRPLFLAYWLRINKLYLHLVANGSVYPELYKSDLFEFEISVPAIEQQDRILKAIRALEYAITLGAALEQTSSDPSRVTKFQEQSRRLSNIREELIPALLSGQLSVTAAPDTFPSMLEIESEGHL